MRIFEERMPKKDAFVSRISAHFDWYGGVWGDLRVTASVFETLGRLNGFLQ